MGGSGLYAAGGGGLFPDLAAAAGTPTNLGKYNEAGAQNDFCNVDQRLT